MEKLSDNIMLNNKSLRNKSKKLKRVKKKTKRVKKKTKRRKNKKKTKRILKGGREPRGNECMYVSADAPGFRNRRERTQDECIRKPGCSWSIKFSPYYPIRGSKYRCHKSTR